MNKVILSIIVLISVSTVPCSAKVLFNQPFTTDNSYASQNDTSKNGYGNFATMYEDFTVNTNNFNYSVNEVQWAGYFADPEVMGNITGWTVNFYTGLGLPPIPGAGGNYAGSAITGPFCGLVDLGWLCSFDLKLAPGSTFSGTSGTKYWISLVPDMEYPPQWFWATGSGGDGISYQDFFGAQYQIDSDLFLELDGVDTPEPGTLVTLGTAVIATGGLLRRKLLG